MEELYIVDEEFQTYCERISSIDAALEARLSSIMSALCKACDAVTEGDFHSNLCTYVLKLSTLQGQISYLTYELQTSSNNFCSSIEEIDTLSD